MDLITQLPCAARGWNSICVVAKRLTKAFHAMPTTADVTAPNIAQLFMKSISQQHWLPKAIISDRDPKSTANF